MNIAVLEPLSIDDQELTSHIAAMEERGVTVTTHRCRGMAPEEIGAAIGDSEAVILTNMPFPDALIRALPALKMVSVAFTGVDHIGMAACRERGIVVSNAQGYATRAVVELVFGLLFALLRKIVQADPGTRAGDPSHPYVGSELAGRRFGVVGAGAIGIEVLRAAQIFGCDVCYADAHESSAAAGLGIARLPLDELIATCDVVSLHVPLIDSTRGLIDARRLGLMQPNAILINTARGPVVETRAFADALREGRLAGACIDVFDTEPPLPTDNPLLAYPDRTVVTPHVGYATREGFSKRAAMVFENITAWMDGAPVRVVG